MAHRKAGGTSRVLRDSNPKYLGMKKNDGQKVQKGMIIVRQRGTKFIAGDNIGQGKDDTLFAKEDGTVKITNKRKKMFTGKIVMRKVVEIVK